MASRPARRGQGRREDGTYAISDGVSETRAGGAKFFIPSEDEWYKAAYHDPRSEPAGGPAGDDNYWLYPTQSDSDPTAEGPPGGANSANFDFAVSDTTDVGAYTSTTSFYGGFDFAGNLFEWNEAVIFDDFRGLRGGSWFDISSFLSASGRSNSFPTNEFVIIGFRVASPAADPAVVPEPQTLGLLVIGGMMFILCGRSRVRR